MLTVYLIKVLLVMLSAETLCGLAELTPRQGCAPDFELCAPPSAKSITVPGLSPDLEDLYVRIVNIVDMVTMWPSSANDTRTTLGPAKRSSAMICCQYRA